MLYSLLQRFPWTAAHIIRSNKRRKYKEREWDPWWARRWGNSSLSLTSQGIVKGKMNVTNKLLETNRSWYSLSPSPSPYHMATVSLLWHSILCRWDIICNTPDKITAICSVWSSLGRPPRSLRKYGVQLLEIVSLNRFGFAGSLKPGTKICIETSLLAQKFWNLQIQKMLKYSNASILHFTDIRLGLLELFLPQIKKID